MSSFSSQEEDLIVALHQGLLLKEPTGGVIPAAGATAGEGRWFIGNVMEYLARRKRKAEEQGLPTTSDSLERLRNQQPAIQKEEDLKQEASLLGPVASWYVGLRGLPLKKKTLSANTVVKDEEEDTRKDRRKEKKIDEESAEQRRNGEQEEESCDDDGRGLSFVMECHATLLPVGASSDSATLYDPLECTTLLEQNWPLMYPYLLPTMFPNASTTPSSSSAGVDSSSSSSSSSPHPPTTLPSFNYLDWKRIRTDPSMMDRFHYSYNIVLHYLGWRLHDQTTGELDRHMHWKERYRALEKSFSPPSSSSPDLAANPHGYYVIAPLLRTLVELRLVQYAKGLLKFILQEFVHERLSFLQRVWSQVWIPYLESVVEEREELNETIRKEVKRLKQRFQKLNESDSD